MAESHENRLKRMQMRAGHRGTKEMDIILGNFAAARLQEMAADDLDRLDSLMEENDQDLYQWITGQTAPPAHFVALIGEIARHAGVE